jgi:chromosome segregation ATPase
MERERNIWGRDEISVLRERIAVLETNLSAMQANIKALTDGQNANRAYTEKSFNELKDAFAKMHEELSDLKLVVTSRAIPTDGQKQTQRYVLAIGALLAILIMVLLVIWIRLGYMGIHL